MHHDQRRRRTKLNGKIAIRYGVQGIATYVVKIKGCSDLLTVDGERCSGQGGRAKRESIDALAAVLQALGVTTEHFGVSQQVMAEGHGLGNLQMSEPGHDRV